MAAARSLSSMPSSCRGCDGFAFQAEQGLRFTQGFELVHHFAFKALEVLKRDVQKISAAAGRVKHAGAAERW